MTALGRPAFLAFLAALLAYGGFLAYTTLANYDLVNLHRDTYIDDAFYYFEIAKNLAAGQFSTFDGGITRTNGYHPVWLLLVTPFYWFFDADSALFGIKALEMVLIAGGVCLLALAARLARLPWILLFAVLPTLYCQRGMLQGMEAAAGAFFLGATLVAAVLFAQAPRRWRWLLAGLAFLLPWVRLEYVAIALFVTGGLGFVLRSGLAGSSPSAAARRLLVAGLPFVAAVAGILAYLLYNGVVFGGILPVSGVAKIGTSTAGASDAVGWATAARRLVRATGRDGLAVAEVGLYVLVVWGLSHRNPRNGTVGLLAVLATVLAFGVENLLVKWQVAVLYTVHVESYSQWYYVPGYLASALLMPVRGWFAIFLLRRFVPARWARWRQPAAVAVCVAWIALAFDPYRFIEPFRSVQQNRHSSYLLHPWGHWNGGLAGELVAFEPMLPDDAILGSWDAGAIGYFADRPVVGLDGVVNSYEYLRMDPDKLRLWLERGGIPAFGVTHLVGSVDQRLGVRHFEYVGNPMGSYSTKLWPHGTLASVSKPWHSVTSPSIGVDGGYTGYRVIRHGRLMQVFVPDCVVGGAATNVPEMLTFIWREGGRRRSEARLWVRPRNTELGYCTMTFLLPHGAAAAAEIFVDGTTVDRVVADMPPAVGPRSGTSVYAAQGRLLYVRERRESGEARTECLRNARRPRQDGSYSFLHVHPVDVRDLRHYGGSEQGFLSYDGWLPWARRSARGRCLAEVELPPFRIREIVTGEMVQGKRIWEGRVDGPALLALQPDV